jgi:hypothetical protein
VLGELLGTLKQLGDKSDAASKRAQSAVSLQLFELIIASTTLEPPLVTLAANLFGLAAKSTHVDKVHLRGAAAWLARRAKADGKAHAELLAKVQQFKLK